MTPDFSVPFEKIDPATLSRRASAFSKMSIDSMSSNEIYDAIVHVITPPGMNSATIPTSTFTYPTGTHFWRARRLEHDDHILPLRDMDKISDAWEAPPIAISRPGRLNKVGEPLIYTCIGAPVSVADEVRAKDREKFSLIKYRSTSPISLTGIGLPIATRGLTDSAAENASLMINFLSQEFLRKKREGFRTYYLSELIAKSFADLPPEFHHGWLYPSVATDGALNATFRAGDARAKLELVGVAVTDVVRENTDMVFSGYAYTECETANGHFVWYRQGSDFQREAFPEFTQVEL